MFFHVSEKILKMTWGCLDEFIRQDKTARKRKINIARKFSDHILDSLLLLFPVQNLREEESSCDVLWSVRKGGQDRCPAG